MTPTAEGGGYDAWRWFWRWSWRIVWTSFRRLRSNQGSLRAAGLTYLTLMALVPVLAVVLGIANAFGVKPQLIKWLQQLRIGEQFIGYAEKVDLGAVGAVGLLVLIYVVLSLLTRIEQAFNVTWDAARGRNLARRYADYVAIVFLIPLLVLAATAFNTLVELESFRDSWPWLRSFVQSGASLVPLVFVWMAATLLFKVMPNVRVEWWPALAAGFGAGGAWYVAQVLFLRFNIGVAQARSLYGPLAFLPVFLLYLYLSWSIVLWGAELCWAIQNHRRLTTVEEELAWTPALRRRLALALMREASREFAAGGSLEVGEFAGLSGWPRARVEEITRVLADCGLIHRIKGGQSIVPAMPPGRIPLHDLFAAIDGSVDDAAPRRGLSEADEVLLAQVRREATQHEGTI